MADEIDILIADEPIEIFFPDQEVTLELSMGTPVGMANVQIIALPTGSTVPSGYVGLVVWLPV